MHPIELQSMPNQHPTIELQLEAFQLLQHKLNEIEIDLENNDEKKNLIVQKIWNLLVPNALVIPSLPTKNNETTSQVFSNIKCKKVNV